MRKFDKSQLTDIGTMVFIIIISVWAVFLAWKYHDNFRQRCRDSGGVPVDMHCINPGSVIEVD